jgi:hypothetical protein
MGEVAAWLLLGVFLGFVVGYTIAGGRAARK